MRTRNTINSLMTASAIARPTWCSRKMPNFDPKVLCIEMVHCEYDAMNTDEHFDDIDDSDAAVEVDGANGSTAGGVARHTPLHLPSRQ